MTWNQFKEWKKRIDDKMSACSADMDDAKAFLEDPKAMVKVTKLVEKMIDATIELTKRFPRE